MEKLTDYSNVRQALDTFQSGGVEPCLDLSLLSDQELLILISAFPKLTCPIVRGLSGEQRAKLPQLMVAITKHESK